MSSILQLNNSSKINNNQINSSSQFSLEETIYFKNSVTIGNENNMTTEVQINSAYQYEDNDIIAILTAAIKPQDSIHVLGPFDNIYTNKFIECLNEFKAKSKNSTLLIPYNLGLYHWVGLVIKVDESDKLTHVTYCDPLGTNEENYINIKNTLKEISKDIIFEAKDLMLQPDPNSCGVLTIENLLLLISNNEIIEKHKINENEVKEIRLKHLNLLKNINFSFYEKFYARQRDNKPTVSSLSEQLKYIKNLDQVKFSPQELERISNIIDFINSLEPKTKNTIKEAFKYDENYEPTIYLESIRNKLQKTSSLSINDENIMKQIKTLLFKLDSFDFIVTYEELKAIHNIINTNLENINEINKKIKKEAKAQIESDKKLAEEIQQQFYQEIFLKDEERIETLEKDIEQAPYKRRLLLGEGDFSYTYALIKKHENTHPDLGKYITATAYESEEQLKKYKNFNQHTTYLKNQGVTLLFEVDATKIHMHPILNIVRFERIHFNFPHDGRSYKDGTLPQIIKEFYNSASQLQKDGDKIHMALPKPPNEKYYDNQNKIASNYFYKGILYNIYDNTRNASYQLIKKRSFGKARYPLYSHVQTKQDTGANVAERFPREYIFEKTNLDSEQIKLLDNERQIKPVYDNYNKKLIIPEIKTDNDSSDYILENQNTLKIELISEIFIARKKLKQSEKLISEFKDLNKRNITVPREQIILLYDHISSLEIFFSGISQENIYTHNSGLNWKNLIATWYYRATVEQSKILNKRNNHIKIIRQYIAQLLIVVENYNKKYDFITSWALSALFYLYNYEFDKKIEKTLLKFLVQPNANWKSKAIAFSILMRIKDKPGFTHDPIVSALLKNIYYEPRLDWLICSFLGHFDLSKYLIDKEKHPSFIKIKDFRLIHIMLQNTNINELLRNNKLMPNNYYSWISTYIHAVKDKNMKLINQPFNKIMSSAVAISSIPISLCIERNKVTDERKIHHILLFIKDIFLPGESTLPGKSTDNKSMIITTNLQDRHQINSFIIIGDNYFYGLNGCRIDYAKALSYYRIPADFGSIQALLNIVKVYSQGLGDFSKETDKQIIDYCLKLAKIPNQKATDLSVVYNCRGYINILRQNFGEAKLCIEIALTHNPDNHFALINKAFVEILDEDLIQARKTLKNVSNKGIELYKLNLLGMINYIEGKTGKGEKELHDALKTQIINKISTMLLYRGICFEQLGYHQRALVFINESLEYCPNNQIIVDYKNKIIGKEVRTISTNKHNNKYELTFKSYTSEEDFKNDKLALEIKSCDYRGYIVYIMINEQNFQLRFVNETQNIIIDNEHVRQLASKIIENQSNHDTNMLYQYIKEIHDILVPQLGVLPCHNPSAEMDGISRIKILNEESDKQDLMEDIEMQIDR